MDPHALIDSLTVALLAKQEPDRVLYHSDERNNVTKTFRVHAKCVPAVNARRRYFNIDEDYEVSYGPRTTPHDITNGAGEVCCTFCGRKVT